MKNINSKTNNMRLRNIEFCEKSDYKTFTLKFYLLDFVDGPATASPIEFDYQIGVINNYDNDRDVYITNYRKAYASLTKVPELSEWQT